MPIRRTVAVPRWVFRPDGLTRIARLRDTWRNGKRPHLLAIAEAAGLTHSTLTRTANGDLPRPGNEVMAALSTLYADTWNQLHPTSPPMAPEAAQRRIFHIERSPAGEQERAA
jgi:hypothetical protein